MTDKTITLSQSIQSNRRSFSFDESMKRAFDIFVSFIGLLMLSPFLGVIALQIKYSSPGPIFYKGKRLGRFGKVFDILKFRTMYERSSSYSGPPITAQDDPRITPFGRWLRDTKVNELPQLWNVLVGDMSLVGPRPEDPTIAETWPEAARKAILSVRPGITSPASVLYRNEETLLRSANVVEDYLRSVLPTKLRLDQLYARNHSFLSDLDVLFWTALALIPGSLEIKIPEKVLFWGPFARIYSRYVTWFVADLVMAFLSVGLVGIMWRTGGPLNMGWLHASFIALGIAFLFSVINAVTGINKIEWSRASPTETIDLALSSGFATALVVIVLTRTRIAPDLPEGLLIFSGLLSFLGFVTVRYRTRLITGAASRWTALRRGSPVGERVLIVGAGDASQFTTWLLFNGPLSRAFTIVGMVDDDPRKEGLRISGCNVLGATSKIGELAKKHDVGVIVFAIERIEPNKRNRLLAACRSTNAKVVVIPDILTHLREEFSREYETPSDIGPHAGSSAPSNGKGNGNGNGKAAASAVTEDAASWLSSLETLADNEDWAALRARIKEMRAAAAGTNQKTPEQ